jgi:hypothetical protein
MSDEIKTRETPSDLVWGAENIGAEINRKAAQVYYLHASGKLKGAVSKLGPKMLVGSRTELRKLPFRNQPS